MNFKSVQSGLVILVALSVMPAEASTMLLTNYDQLLLSLQQGNDVAAIIYPAKCVSTSANNITSNLEGASTRLNFTMFSHYKIKTDNQHTRYAIATSLTIPTEHSSLGLVYAYSRLRIFEDNSAEYHTAYYDAKTYTLKGSASYLCKIGQGINDGAVNLLEKT